MTYRKGDLVQSRYMNNVWLVTGMLDDGWAGCVCVYGMHSGQKSTAGPGANMHLLARDVTEPIDEAWPEALIALKGIGS